VQLHNDHSNPMVPLMRPHDKSSLGNRWKVAGQKIGEFWLVAKSSHNSNNMCVAAMRRTGAQAHGRRPGARWVLERATGAEARSGLRAHRERIEGSWRVSGR
jgi:hypothetical protein